MEDRCTALLSVRSKVVVSSGSSIRCKCTKAVGPGSVCHHHSFLRHYGVIPVYCQSIRHAKQFTPEIKLPDVGALGAVYRGLLYETLGVFVIAFLFLHEYAMLGRFFRGGDQHHISPPFHRSWRRLPSGTPDNDCVSLSRIIDRALALMRTKMFYR